MNNQLVFTIPSAMDSTSCDRLVEYIKTWATTQDATTGAFPWNRGNTRCYAAVPDPYIRQIIEAYKFRTCQIVGGHYGELLYPLLTDLVAWTPGNFMDAHADNGEGTPGREDLRGRKYTAVLYLNDGFVGGETFVLDSGEKHWFTPVKGTALVMTADERCLHGVERLRAGLRYTMPLWMTNNPRECESA